MKSIIELARETGMLVHIPFPSDTEVAISIERFAAVVRAQALEEAAAVCDEAVMFHEAAAGSELAGELAAAIRALKTKEKT